MDWLDLLAVQGTLKSLLQHHSSKASILRRSTFFTVQLSHPYMTTGKTIALTSRTFVGKVCLCFCSLTVPLMTLNLVGMPLSSFLLLVIVVFFFFFSLLISLAKGLSNLLLFFREWAFGVNLFVWLYSISFISVLIFVYFGGSLDN